MAIEDTPWFIGAEGVLHPAEAARAVGYAAANGQDGVIGTTDLKVTQTGTPSGRVMIYPGAINLVNRYPGAQAQAYTGVVRTATYVNIDPTTSSGPRSDLIVARVRDPQYGSQSGYDANNPNNFNFFSIEVVKGVSASFRRYTDQGYPIVAIARIDIPANTGTITNGMIKDLRVKSLVRSWRRAYPTFPTANQALTGNTADWLTTGQPTVVVPFWATRANIIVHVEGVEKLVAGYVRGEVKITVAGISTESVSITQNGPTATRFGISFGGSVAIPRIIRGDAAALSLRGVIAVGSSGAYQIDAGSAVTFDIEFLEDVE